MRDESVESMVKRMEARAIVEGQYEWRKWMKEIPAINFPSEWNVKIIPPFGGAIARFHVSVGEASVSVYLDCYDELGIVGMPYWELYPDHEGDNYRCDMYETDELIKEIQKSLNEQLYNEGDSNE
jgi:hypothetical protein